MSEAAKAPSSRGHKVNCVHIWIATYANGRESIISADLPFPTIDAKTLRHMPLFSPNRATAEALGNIARRFRVDAASPDTQIVSISLRSFDAVPL